MLEAFIWGTSLFLLFSFIHYASKKKKPFKRAFLSLLSGVAVLVIVDLFAANTGVYLPVTGLSLTAAAAGGIPGVALLVMLTML